MNRGSETAQHGVPDPIPGFNEAPIHESGKYERPKAETESPKVASMRPRFMNRGSCGAGRECCIGTTSFNEAPIHESGKSARTDFWFIHVDRFNEAPIHESGK